MNEECINISKCICQWCLMQVFFFSFCNIKIVALINSLLKPPSAALSAHTKERGDKGRRGGHLFPSVSLTGGGRNRVKDRKIRGKCIHSPPHFAFLVGVCIRIYGEARHTPSGPAPKSASSPFVRRATFCLQHERTRIAPRCARRGDGFLHACQFRRARRRSGCNEQVV